MVGDGVRARGDTGTCTADFLLGDRTALNLGINPWREPAQVRNVRNDKLTQTKKQVNDQSGGETVIYLVSQSVR